VQIKSLVGQKEVRFRLQQMLHKKQKTIEHEYKFTISHLFQFTFVSHWTCHHGSEAVIVVIGTHVNHQDEKAHHRKHGRI
jgi:hypothetical protein